MIKKIAGNVGDALAQATNASKGEEDEIEEDGGDDEENTEQAIDDFAKEPNVGGGEAAPTPNVPQDADAEDNKNPQQPAKPTEQTPPNESDKGTATTPQPTKEEGGDEKEGAGDEGNKEMLASNASRLSRWQGEIKW